jgi:hypothetical protein
LPPATISLKIWMRIEEFFFYYGFINLHCLYITHVSHCLICYLIPFLFWILKQTVSSKYKCPHTRKIPKVAIISKLPGLGYEVKIKVPLERRWNMKALSLTIYEIWSMLQVFADRQAKNYMPLIFWYKGIKIKSLQFAFSVFHICTIDH